MKNGVEYDINGKSVYGVYVSGQKKLYFNAKVYKDEEEAIIYMLHEMKHALDDNEKSIGFDSKTVLVAMKVQLKDLQQIWLKQY